MTRALYPGSKTPLLAAILVAGVSVLLGACGSKQPSASPAPSAAASAPATTAALASPSAGSSTSQSGVTVTVQATDFLFHLNPTTVPAGPVHFVFVNQSKTYLHELWVYPQEQPKLKDLLAAKDASKNAGNDVNAEDYLQGVVGKLQSVPEGKTETLDVTLKPGVYELSCFQVSSIAGKNMVHYEMGMHTILTAQ